MIHLMETHVGIAIVKPSRNTSPLLFIIKDFSPETWKGRFGSNWSFHMLWHHGLGNVWSTISMQFKFSFLAVSEICFLFLSFFFFLEGHFNLWSQGASTDYCPPFTFCPIACCLLADFKYFLITTHCSWVIYILSIAVLMHMKNWSWLWCDKFGTTFLVFSLRYE